MTTNATTPTPDSDTKTIAAAKATAHAQLAQSHADDAHEVWCTSPTANGVKVLNPEYYHHTNRAIVHALQAILHKLESLS